MPYSSQQERLESGRRWYRTNPAAKEKVVAAKRRYQARNQALLDDIPKPPCAHCGWPLDFMLVDLNHWMGSTLRRMARRPVGLVRMQAEIDKCELRCVNCRRLQ